MGLLAIRIEVQRGQLTCDCDLRASVTKLCNCSMEQTILLMEGFDRSVRVSRFGLELHVGIRNFRNSRAKTALLARYCRMITLTTDLQEEYSREQEAETSNGEVNPLHVLQGFLALSHADEDDIRPKDWRNNGADAVEGLGDVDSELRVSRGSANCNVRVCSSFERTQAVANDKDGCAESTKGLVKNTWPCN